MSVKTFFINSTVAEYNDDEFAWFQSLLLAEGIIGDPVTGALGLAVIQNGTPDMSVLIGTGKALVELTKSGRTFKVVVSNDAQIQVTIPANVSGSNRVDAIIVRVDKDVDPNISKTNVSTIERVAGTGATALSDGAIGTAVGSDGWYRLANVTVTNGDVAIITAEIADTRVKTEFNNGMSFGAIVPAGAATLYGGTVAPATWLLCDGAAISRTTYASLFAAIGTSYGAGDGSTTFNVPNMKSRFPLGYSASAPTKTFTFASRSSDTLTVTGSDNHANNEIQTGQAVLYDTTSEAIGGLVDNTTYYLIRVAYNQFKLATSVANANADTFITLSSDGSGVQTFVATYTARPLGQSGGEETHSITDAEMPSHVHGVNWQLSSSGVQSAWTQPVTDPSATKSTTDITGSDTPHNSMPLFMVWNYIIKT